MTAKPASIGDAFLGKVPPHSNEAELAVIGGVILHNKTLSLVIDHVSPTDFYAERHEIIFQTIVDLDTQRRPIDLISLPEALKEKGELESVGGPSYLAGILDQVPTAANIEMYAQIVREKAAVRACLGAALDILQKGYGDYGDADTFLDESEQCVFEATRRREQGRLFKLGPAFTGALDEIQRLQHVGGNVTGMPSGYVDLDRLTRGFQPQDLIIIAGRPSMGKTALGLKMALNAVKMTQKAVILFSLEMGINQLISRILTTESRVPASKILLPRRLTDEDYAKIIEVSNNLYGKEFYIDDSSALNVLEVRSRARYLGSKVDLGLIVIDYLQLMSPLRRVRGETSREREIADTTRALKALAKELGVPVICLSQLNRSPELRANKRPQLSDLRESGAIEQDADLILFVYRDAVYTNNLDDNSAEIIIGKNRNGPVGTVMMTFLKDLVSFENREDAIYSAEDYGNMMLPARPPEGPEGEEEPF